MNFCNYKTCLYSDPYKCKENPTLKFTQCIQCNTVNYCSNNCKIQDWTNHKQVCTAGNNRIVISDLNKSENNINTTDISGKSSFLQSKKTLKDYELVNGSDIKFADLGKGAYGSVKLVKEKATGKFFALKIVNKKNLMMNAKPEYLKREIKLQKSLDHPHIIKLFHTFEDNENVYLVLEYAKNGSLFFYLRKKKKCEEKEAFIFFFQTCIGIDYLHKKGILHRDIKPENLLLDEKGNIKLCDFGWCADSSTETRNTFCGTLDYMAPEMLKNQPHDKTVDIWSLGVLLYELLHGYAPFGGISDRDKISKITTYDFKMGEHISKDARDLIVKLMKTNPKERIDFTHVFSHPWLKAYELQFKMNMDKFIYDPNKSRSRSRSRSPNVSNIVVDKPKDKYEPLKEVPKSPLAKQDLQSQNLHANRFGKTEDTKDDKRGRSNSPMTSNYNMNNLGVKNTENSLNNSSISNKLNNSNFKNMPDPQKKPEPEKKNTMLVSSKSYENLQRPLIQNPILNTNSREPSISPERQKNNDRSKSPDDKNRGKIFDSKMTKIEIDSKFKEENKIEQEKKTSYKPPPQTGVTSSPEKKSYRAAKISEIDDSLLKEIEKAKEIENKLEKIMKTNKDLLSQVPSKSAINQPKPEPKIQEPSKKQYEIETSLPTPKNFAPNTTPNRNLNNIENEILATPKNVSGFYTKNLNTNASGKYFEDSSQKNNIFNESNQRNKLPKGLVDPMNSKMTERNRSPSPLRNEQNNTSMIKNEGVNINETNKNKTDDRNRSLSPMNNKNHNESYSQMNTYDNNKNIHQTNSNNQKDNTGNFQTNTNNNRSLSPINTNNNKNNSTNNNNNSTNDNKNLLQNSSSNNRSLSPMNNNDSQKKKEEIYKSKDEKVVNREEPLAKFGSSDKFNTKGNLTNLNESAIPFNSETANYSMQNDSTSEFFMNELNNQKKAPSSKTISNKGMTTIKEQNEEKNTSNLKEKKSKPANIKVSEEDNRTTNIRDFLENFRNEMKIEENSENILLNNLYGLNNYNQNQGCKIKDDSTLDKINKEIVGEIAISKKKTNIFENSNKKQKNDENSFDSQSKSRNELTFAEHQNSSQKKPQQKANPIERADNDEVGEEISEDETSRRNTALQRKMEDNIHKSPDRAENNKNRNNKIKKEDLFNPDEDSFESFVEDTKDYFKQFELDKKKKNAEEDDLPKFGKSKKKDADYETHLDKKINEIHYQLSHEEENDDKFNFKNTIKKKEIKTKETAVEENSFAKKEKPLKKIADQKPKYEEPLEIHDSDMDKENTIVEEDELEMSLRDNGIKKKNKKGSLNDKSQKLAEHMKNLKNEDVLAERNSEEDEEETSSKTKKAILKKYKNDKKASNTKVERGQQTSVKIQNKSEKKQKKNKNPENDKKDFEDQREKAMKQFYNSFALIEEGKYNRDFDQKLYYSFDDKANQQIDEKEEDSDTDERSQKPKKGNKSKNKQKSDQIDEKLDKIIKSKLDKALLDPRVAKKWLENQNSDKDLDMNFLPKQLAITSLNNYKDSNERLKKKNDQLKVLMTQLDSDEEESKRISRISKKSYIMEKTAVKSVEEMGFFEKLLFSFGCFKRNDPSMTTTNKEKPKENKKKKKTKK